MQAGETIDEAKVPGNHIAMTTERKEYFFIVYNVCFAAFMATLDSYIVNVSLPSISQHFNITMSTVSLVVLSYLLSLTSTTLIFGKLADTIGLKKMFTWGYLVFTIGSLFCGISWSIWLLIASRFIQGVGGAMIIISGYAIVPKYLPHEIRGWAFGYLSIVAAFGVIVGTPLGGIITGYFSWHWIFLINIPVGIIAIFTSHRTLPDDGITGAEKKKAPFDIQGALLSFIGILAIIYGLNYGKECGWSSPPIIISFFLVITAFVLFIIVEGKSPDPLLDLSIFKNIPFVCAIIASTTALMVLSGNNFILPFYLEMGKGLKPQQVGFLLMIYALMGMIVGPRAGRASDTIKPVLLCAIAMFSATLACMYFAVTLHFYSLIPVIIFLFWYGISNALFLSPNNNLVMSQASENKHGTASGVFNLFGRLSLVLGVCVFETIFSEVIPLGDGSLHSSKIPANVLNHGFQIVYVCASLLCFVSLVVSMLSARKRTEKTVENN